MENQKILETIENFDEYSLPIRQLFTEESKSIFGIIYLKLPVYCKSQNIRKFALNILKDEKALKNYSESQTNVQELLQGQRILIAVCNSFEIEKNVAIVARKLYLDAFLKTDNKYSTEESAQFFSELITNDAQIKPIVLELLKEQENIEIIPLLKSNALEVLIIHLATENCPQTVNIFTKICSTPSRNKFNSIIERLLYIRLFSSTKPLRNLLENLSKVKEILDSNFIHSKLFVRSLELWADKTSIERSSVYQRLYISSIVALIVFHFGTEQLDLHKQLTTLLNGISNHLSSNRREISNLGMELGQWLTGKIDLPIDSEESKLKFDVVEDENVLKLRKIWSDPVEKETEEVKTPQKVQEPIIEKFTALEIDSDDDDDIGGFTEATQTQNDKITWQKEPSGGPYYVRECLDGLCSNAIEDNKLFTRCLLRMEQIILRHPIMAKELSLEATRTLLHLNLPNQDEELEANRLKSLVAIACVDPPKVSDYLIAQLSAPRTPLSIKTDVVYTITNMAVQLSQAKPRLKSKSLASTIDAYKKGHVNIFLEYSGLIFNRLLIAVKQCPDEDQRESFVRSRVLSCLGVVYAASQGNLKWHQMTEELADLCQSQLTHQDPIVRRSAITTLGILLSINEEGRMDECLDNVKKTVVKLIKRESDEECKRLAILSIK